MIAALRGTLSRKELDGCVVDVGGVGYLVIVSAQTLGALPAEGEPVQLCCHTHVREDALQIFGFLEPVERTAFELLITVSGVGPKVALTALSGMPVRELLEAIAAEDHRRLQTIPGIGKKTAERMVVDLKERCARLARELELALPDAEGRPRPRPLSAAADGVVEALVGLGYRRQTAEQAVERALQQTDGPPQLERLLREALACMREG